jgi:hypothetical protein
MKTIPRESAAKNGRQQFTDLARESGRPAALAEFDRRVSRWANAIDPRLRKVAYTMGSLADGDTHEHWCGREKILARYAKLHHGKTISASTLQRHQAELQALGVITWNGKQQRSGAFDGHPHAWRSNHYTVHFGVAVKDGHAVAHDFTKALPDQDDQRDDQLSLRDLSKISSSSGNDGPAPLELRGEEQNPDDTDNGGGEPLRKRRAVLAMVLALHAAGVPGRALAEVIPRSRFLPVEGVLSDEALTEAFVRTYPSASGRLGRWFLEAPIHDADKTWVLTKMWEVIRSEYSDALLVSRPLSQEFVTSRCQRRSGSLPPGAFGKRRFAQGRLGHREPRWLRRCIGGLREAVMTPEQKRLASHARIMGITVDELLVRLAT